MSSPTAKAGKSKKQQSCSTAHCNNSSRTLLTNDNDSSLSIPVGLSSKPTKSSAISSSVSTANAATTAVVAAAADDTTNNHCNALKYCNGGVTSYQHPPQDGGFIMFTRGRNDVPIDITSNVNDSDTDIQNGMFILDRFNLHDASSLLIVYTNVKLYRTIDSLLLPNNSRRISIEEYATMYIGSSKEIFDVKVAYLYCNGNTQEMLKYVTLSTDADIDRWMTDIIEPQLQYGYDLLSSNGFEFDAPIVKVAFDAGHAQKGKSDNI